MTPLPHTVLQELDLRREDGRFRAVLCLSRCGWDELQAARAAFLHPREAERFDGLEFQRRRESYLRGCYCAKLALDCQRAGAALTDRLIDHGVFGQPIISGPGTGGIQVSISHSGGWGAALAFEEAHPMAIDIEQREARQQDVIRSEMSPREIEAIASTALPSAMRLTLLWTIKESLAKVLRCGLMTPFSVYAIESIQAEGMGIASTFTNFAQYKSLSVVCDDLAVSIALPRKTTLAGGLRIQAP